MKNLFIIAGPNGAGKTTSSLALLEKFAIDEYVNADAIAYGLSPLQSESVAIQAGRLMLERIHFLLDHNKSFAFETTLASRSFINLIKQAKNRGYKINLLFLWLENIELALERVKRRVESGGHDIPKETIIRRYKKGLENFFKLYAPITDEWVFYNNSTSFSVMIAEKLLNNTVKIYNKPLWRYLKNDH